MHSNVISKAITAGKQPTSKQSLKQISSFLGKLCTPSDSNFFENCSLRFNYVNSYSLQSN